MKHVYPSVREGVTRFGREAMKIRESRKHDGLPTVSIDKLDSRYQQCGPCVNFSGVCCEIIGCSSHRRVLDVYFNMILDPNKACEFKPGGFS